MPQLSYAQAACAALAEAMRADSRVVVLGEDVGRGGVFAQYRGLQQEFGPDRVVDTPISEATIFGAAVGMALNGLKPVVEMRVIDFALCAMDEVVNQAAKARYMFGGQGRVPLVARMPIGLWAALPRSTRSRSKPGSRMYPGWWSSRPRRPPTTTHSCTRRWRAAIPSSTWSTRSSGACKGRFRRGTVCRSAPPRSAAKGGTPRS